MTRLGVDCYPEMSIKLDRSKLVRQLAAKSKLVVHIDRAIDENPDFPWTFVHNPKIGDDAWHPSVHSTPSLWELYQITQPNAPTRTYGPGLKKTFMVGHFWHAYLQHIVVEKLKFASWHDIERKGSRGWTISNGRPTFIEGRKFEPFHWVTGSADIAPCEIPGVGSCLIDFKTMNQFDFKKPYIPEWCADKWECQANIYMDWFDLEEAIFVAICKDSPHEMKEFIFPRNQDLVDALYAKWALVSQCVKEQIEPPQSEIFHLPIKGPNSA